MLPLLDAIPRAEQTPAQLPWRDLIDLIGPSMFVGLMTPQGILIEANRPALVAAGLKPEDVLGKPFEDTYWWAWSPDIQRELREAIARAAAGEGSRYDVRLRSAEHQFIDIDFSLQPLLDEDGAVVYLVPSASVITGLAQTEKALLESNENFRLLTDNITDAFWIRSPDMHVLHYVSPAFERIWGRPAASLYANPHQWSDFTLAEDREQTVAAFAGLMADTPSIDIEYRIVRADGEIRWVRVRGFQVRDAAGVLIRLTGIVTDMTDKKRLESQFFRAQRLEGIGTLAGGIAHDLNNVLAPILLAVEMLKDVVKKDEDLAVLATLEGSARRGADLVKQVLSFARGVEGLRITVSPLHVMRDLLKVMHDTFPKTITVRYTPAPDLWTVTGDPTQIHQVFLNLCVNARDAMPDGGSLTVTMANVVMDEDFAALNLGAHAGAYVMVRIDDTGSGIAPEIRERVFEPFFTTKGVGQGTGLGLSTILAIVKSHGGFINLYSEVGTGTSFKVYLPANPGMTATDPVPEKSVPLPRGHGELILVVDDEEAIRKVARRTLERFGYRVLVAANGAEGVGLYAQHRAEVAVVVTDMAMPVMDGPAMILTLKAVNPAVRIIASSGFASQGETAAAVEAGVQHFVAKPYTASTMLNTLRDVLGEKGNGGDHPHG